MNIFRNDTQIKLIFQSVGKNPIFLRTRQKFIHSALTELEKLTTGGKNLSVFLTSVNYFG